MTNSTANPAGNKFNKYAYAVFVAAGIIFFSIKDYSQAAVFMGLAPVFDPFNQSVAFDKRPLWQRAWLIVHLLLTIGLFVLMIIADK
ncbi:MAG: hypothetical protein IPP72_14955 [Chitinophagaceae bacterium]|nr:hypothetical protein [Chitinophagaceae bacterium]